MLNSLQIIYLLKILALEKVVKHMYCIEKKQRWCVIENHFIANMLLKCMLNDIFVYSNNNKNRGEKKKCAQPQKKHTQFVEQIKPIFVTQLKLNQISNRINLLIIIDRLSYN